MRAMGPRKFTLSLPSYKNCLSSAQGPRHCPGMLLVLSVVHSATWLNNLAPLPSTCHQKGFCKGKVPWLC